MKTLGLIILLTLTGCATLSEDITTPEMRCYDIEDAQGRVREYCEPVL